MSLSRRSFMKSGAMAAVAAGFLLESPILTLAQDKIQSGPLLGYFQVPDEARQDPLFSYNRSTFEPYVGGIFTSRDARSRVIELKLVRVREYKPTPKGRFTTTRVTTTGGTTTRNPVQTDCFSLLFQASRDLPPFTSIYTIEHGALGKFDLFMVRSVNRSQIFYEAVINHIS